MAPRRAARRRSAHGAHVPVTPVARALCALNCHAANPPATCPHPVALTRRKNVRATASHVNAPACHPLACARYGRPTLANVTQIARTPRCRAHRPHAQSFLTAVVGAERFPRPESPPHDIPQCSMPSSPYVRLKTKHQKGELVLIEKANLNIKMGCEELAKKGDGSSHDDRRCRASSQDKTQCDGRLRCEFPGGVVEAAKLTMVRFSAGRVAAPRRRVPRAVPVVRGRPRTARDACTFSTVQTSLRASGYASWCTAWCVVADYGPLSIQPCCRTVVGA